MKDKKYSTRVKLEYLRCYYTKLYFAQGDWNNLIQADTILMEKESPEYTRFEFMSDIGGTAGLILGVSLASMISMVERIVKKMLRKIM